MNIDNCWFDGQVFVKLDGCYSGGIVGQVIKNDSVDNSAYTVNIINCLNTGYISIAKYQSAPVTTSTDTNRYYSYTGGILGMENGTGFIINMSNCMNAGVVELHHTTYAGSLVGRPTSASTYTFTNCYVTNGSFIYTNTNGVTKEIATAYGDKGGSTTINGTPTFVNKTDILGAKATDATKGVAGLFTTVGTATETAWMVDTVTVQSDGTVGGTPILKKFGEWWQNGKTVQ